MNHIESLHATVRSFAMFANFFFPNPHLYAFSIKFLYIIMRCHSPWTY